MSTFLQLLAAFAAALSLAGVAAAQVPLRPDSLPGTATVDVTAGSIADAARPQPVVTVPVAAATAPSVFMPQPAEHLGQASGAGGPWFVVAPYAWIFGMHGQVGARGRVFTVDESVSDAAQAAVEDLKGALQLHVEAGYGDVGVIADLTYMRVEPLDGIARVEQESTIFELIGFYRVCGNGCREAGAVTFDVLAGARHYRFSNSLQLFGVDLSPIDRTNSWTDLIVGARASVQVSENLSVFARADVGGFGIGHASKQSCNVVTGFEYHCSQCCSLYGGYRWLKIDRSAGIGRDSFLLDATLAGPFVAFGLRF